MKLIISDKIIQIILIILGAISILYSIILIFRGVTFYQFFIILGILLISVNLFFLAYPSLFKYSLIAKILKYLLIVFLISFIIIESRIIYVGNKKDTTYVDYIVVLGAGVKGYTPSLTLQYRLVTALQYHHQHPNTKIVLSGGQGNGENISEADAMKKFLIDNGVDENLLMIEDKSTNTFQNLVLSQKIIRKFDNRSNLKIAIVTSNFHMLRAKLIAKRINFEPYGVPAPIPAWLAPTYYIREYFGICKSFLLDR